MEIVFINRFLDLVPPLIGLVVGTFHVHCMMMAVHSHHSNLVARMPDVLLPMERAHHEFGGGDPFCLIDLNKSPSIHGPYVWHYML